MAGKDGLAASLKEVVHRAQRLAKLQAELAAAEVRERAASFGAAAGMFVGAAVLASFAVAFLLALITAALAIVLPVWLAILIVFVLLCLAAATLGALGARLVRRAGPPVPKRAVEEAKRTQKAIQTSLRRQPIEVAVTAAPEPPPPATNAQGGPRAG
jgi:hypothetical protein